MLHYREENSYRIWAVGGKREARRFIFQTNLTRALIRRPIRSSLQSERSFLLVMHGRNSIFASFFVVFDWSLEATYSSQGKGRVQSETDRNKVYHSREQGPAGKIVSRFRCRPDRTLHPLGTSSCYHLIFVCVF